MDRAIQPKRKWIGVKGIGAIFGLLLIALMSYNMVRPSQVNIQKNTIRIKAVKQGDFEDAILFNSTVEPKTSIFVNIIEGGSVSEIFAENGQMVKKGDPLLRVYKPKCNIELYDSGNSYC